MTLEQWMVCTTVACCLGAGCGSVPALPSDAGPGSGGGSEGVAHPDAGVAVDAGTSPDAGTPSGPQRCSGTGCDNLDPTQSLDTATGVMCSTGATTAGSTSADGGTLELRWGPSCRVNWARFTPGTGGAKLRIWAGRQSPAAETDRYEFTTTAQLQEFSNEVFAPGAARACIEQWNGSSWVNPICTPWI